MLTQAIKVPVKQKHNSHWGRAFKTQPAGRSNNDTAVLIELIVNAKVSFDQDPATVPQPQ